MLSVLRNYHSRVIECSEGNYKVMVGYEFIAHHPFSTKGYLMIQNTYYLEEMYSFYITLS